MLFRSGGTWERIEDRFLLASGTTYTAGGTGGEAEHTLSESEIPAHTHGSKSLSGYVQGVLLDDGATITRSGIVTVSVSRARSWNGTTGTACYRVAVDASHAHNSVGGDQPHNNMPPYLAVYIWKRTA